MQLDLCQHFHHVAYHQNLNPICVIGRFRSNVRIINIKKGVGVEWGLKEEVFGSKHVKLVDVAVTKVI